jgi:hypothetical protein
MCVLFEGDLTSHREGILDLPQLNELLKGIDDDVGTLVIAGNLQGGTIQPSTRLMCLVVTGNLLADLLYIRETEVLVCGDLKVRRLDDHDGHLKVLGHSDIGESR